jgi:hypothetical protein
VDGLLPEFSVRAHCIVPEEAARRPAPSARRPTHFDFTFDDIGWEDALGLVLVRRHELRERDRRFVESLNEWRGMPTAKQLAWLRDIYERLGGRA